MGKCVLQGDVRTVVVIVKRKVPWEQVREWCRPLHFREGSCVLDDNASGRSDESLGGATSEVQTIGRRRSIGQLRESIPLRHSSIVQAT